MKRELFKKLTFAAACVSLSVLVACGNSFGGDAGSRENRESQSGTSAGDQTETVSVEPVTDETVSAEETTAEFSIVTADGVYEPTAAGYRITAAGTYTLSGALDGQILVEAGDEDDVTLELAGVTITCSEDSPIKIVNANGVDVSAKKSTDNVIKDVRAQKTVDTDDLGEGAIYAKTDLKLKGAGTLVVEGNYNNGVHTTKDLKIQKLSLKAVAVNNAIKGNDSVSISSGTVVAVSTAGDGVKTQNTDANKSGLTRGDVTISDGALTVYAAGDGIQAAHDFIVSAEEGASPVVAIYTGSYSGYTSSSAKTDSYKGIKVQNELNVSGGTLIINSYDDGLHADYGTAFDAGGTGAGTINLSGGTVTVSVYAPTGKTGGGRTGPRGWGNQQTVSGADGVHADYKLNISGGTVNVDSAYEGLEANVITISGGTVYASATDDGVNACKGVSAPQITVTGGYLDVTVSPSGDTDGIDSNGSYSQEGGVVITRGPSSDMAAAIDADGTVKVTGGTLIVLGYGRVSTGGSVKTYSLSLHAAGDHTVYADGIAYTFTNAYSYARTYCYSGVSVTA